jgi:agmatine/peptidylarginine deiminase
MKKFSTLMSALILSTGLFFTSSNLFAQSDDFGHSLPREMTADEVLHIGDIGKSFVETTPPAGSIRNIAEFEQMEGALIRYPFGIPYTLIAEMSQNTIVWTVVANASQKTTVTNNYTSNNVNLANVRWIIAPSDSYWTRDYGPWFVHYGDHQLGIIDFPYNRPRPNDDEIPKVVADSLNIDWFGMNLIHTGGNYMTTGAGMSSSTDLTVVENPTLTQAQIQQKASDYMGVTTYSLVADPNGTYIDHIDCWGKYLAPDKILVRSVPSNHAQYTLIEQTASFYANQISPYGTPYKVFRVNTPGNQPYTNSVIINNKVLMPFMNNLALDTAAQHAYQLAMPGYNVIGFIGLTGGAAWQSTDALHCRVMGLADRGMLEIVHMPYTGHQPIMPQYPVNAEIFAYSQAGLLADSVYMSYSINGGPWVNVQMTPLGGTSYTSNIPGQVSGTIVRYYIHAQDNAGRTANHAIMGSIDPHIFDIGTTSVDPIQGYDPATATLDNAWPNPFSLNTTIGFTIRTAGAMKLEILDIQGKVVNVLKEEYSGIGHFLVNWDGTTSKGNNLTPGVYFSRLICGNKSWVKKLVLLP